MSNKNIKVKSKRYQLQCQIFSCQTLTSSIGQIASEVLLQGFDLLDRANRFKPFLPGFHLLDRKSDASCNSLRRYAFWLKTPYIGYGALVETPDFANIIKIVELRLGLGDSNRVCP